MLDKHGSASGLHLDTLVNLVNIPQTPTHCQYPPQSPTHPSPSYYRRQEHRKAAKAADATVTNNEETSAEEAGCVIKCDVISTEKVDYPHQELEPEKK